MSVKALSADAGTVAVAATGTPLAMRTAKTLRAPPAKACSRARVSVRGVAASAGVAKGSAGPNRSMASDRPPSGTTVPSGPRAAVPTIPMLPVAMPPTPIRPSARTSM